MGAVVDGCCRSCFLACGRIALVRFFRSIYVCSGIGNRFSRGISVFLRSTVSMVSAICYTQCAIQPYVRHVALSVAHAAAIGVCIAHDAWYGFHRAHAAAHHVYVLYAVRGVLACGTLTTFSRAWGPPPQSGPYGCSVRRVACVVRVSRTPRVPRGPVFFLMAFARIAAMEIMREMHVHAV
jgi:hypothetical protein